MAAIVPGPAVVPGGAVDRLPRAAARSHAHARSAAFARDELRKMGPLSRDEWITLLVFAGVGLTVADHGVASASTSRSSR